ncbi:hypothetical protein CDL12_11469 [Handroanthus impetiginosus]|uniref:Uncharacterized protein n=1 Tax=Handroanthus impetiginosus TaxID=429701 RepID=A0A2G9HEL0_9LAMI|nr:hypothetical protein CDL12_11469 [Handroanthus impetiginosus]
MLMSLDFGGEGRRRRHHWWYQDRPRLLIKEPTPLAYFDTINGGSSAVEPPFSIPNQMAGGCGAISEEPRIWAFCFKRAKEFEKEEPMIGFIHFSIFDE